MAQPKIIKLGLEDVILESRRARRSLDGMTEDANAELARRGQADTVTKSTVKRWLASIDVASVSHAHDPEIAEQNARVAIDVYDRLQGLDVILQGWLKEAAEAVTPMKGVLWDPHLQAPADRHRALEAEQHLVDEYREGGDDVPEYVRAVSVLIPDWGARLGTAKEVRQHAEAVTNLLERIHNAAQVDEFQRAMLEAIREADPGVANRILEKLRGLQAARTLVAATPT